MEYLTLEFAGMKMGEDSRYLFVPNEFHNFSFNLNLIQLDPTIQDVYAEVNLLSYYHTHKRQLKTNVDISLKRFDRVNGVIVEENDMDYKELVMNYLHQYPIVLDDVHAVYTRLAKGSLLRAKINKNSFLNHKVKIAIECANIFPSGEEHRAFAVLIDVLKHYDNFELTYSSYHVQKSFSNKEYDYKIGRCIIGNIRLLPIEGQYCYMITNSRNNVFIKDKLNDIRLDSQENLLAVLKDVMLKIQSTIQKPIKIAIVLNNKFYIFSQLDDTEYMKNIII